jgi:transcriptional regulator with XRE-family HTH domain
MTVDNPSPTDLGRRLAAARAYRQVHQIPLAKMLGLDPATLGRYEKGEGLEGPVKRAGVIERSSKELDLPREFFSVDFSKLPEMAAAWHRVRDEAATPEEMIAAQERDEAETLPPDPSASQNEEQEP